jgi:hypothetical protein
MINMSDVTVKIIGKIIAVDLDIEGNLHITLKNSSPIGPSTPPNTYAPLPTKSSKSQSKNGTRPHKHRLLVPKPIRTQKFYPIQNTSRPGKISPP